MDVAIIGANGNIGRLVAQMIVSERLLECDRRLLLVGHHAGRSARSLYGLAADLQDAYAEISPRIEVVLEPAAIQADLVLVAAGTTTSLDTHGEPVSRDTVAAINAPMFEEYGQALAHHGRGTEIVICISNPVELAVGIFSKHLGPQRVMGMGAFLDSMRFRREIAWDLGVPRQQVHGFVAGEHGELMVPLWSTVHVYGLSDDELANSLLRVRRGYHTAGFFDDARQAVAQISPLIMGGQTLHAYELVNELPPDLRVVLKPYVTHFSGAKTAIGTAHATLELVRTVMMGHDAVISGQIATTEWLPDRETVIGLPLVVGNRGVEQVLELDLWPDERALLTEAAESIASKIASFI